MNTTAVAQMFCNACFFVWSFHFLQGRAVCKWHILSLKKKIFKEKLKQFQERLVEERKQRLEERKKQRKEERRNSFYRQKEEEAQRIREEQLKKGTACLFIFNVLRI